MSQLAVITCGPSHTPIDSVRRITNFATGEIGTILAQALVARGWEVICFRGEGSTSPPPTGVDLRSFTTNNSLAQALQSLTCQPRLVFHAAALCDFQVARIEGARIEGARIEGARIEGARIEEKIPSRRGPLTLLLEPAPKVLPRLRDWFPEARLAGWKYELEGTRPEVLEKAAAQIVESRTDACVVNGRAFGTGFGILLPDGTLHEQPDKTSLAAALLALLAS
jgi:phosphopantothenoylcysteine decarboxylase/phosphopantothenate--cysteine ligase